MGFIQVEPLGLLSLARTLLLWFALELLESLLHESYCSVRLNRAIFVNRPCCPLDTLDVLVPLCLQWFRVRQIGFQALYNIDDVDEVAHGFVRLLLVCLPTPFRSLSVYPLRLIH